MFPSKHALFPLQIIFVSLIKVFKLYLKFIKLFNKVQHCPSKLFRRVGDQTVKNCSQIKQNYKNHYNINTLSTLDSEIKYEPITFDQTNKIFNIVIKVCSAPG